MNLSYSHLIPHNFHNTSRVWVYQSSRMFSIGEALEIEDLLTDFVEAWNSHGTPVKGYANLLFGQFVVVMADETATGVSGCSTDSSVRVIKRIEELCKVQLFDRQMLAFVIKDKVQLLPVSQLKYAVENDFINGDTLYFNNLIESKQALLHNWLVPLKNSWLAKRVKLKTEQS